MGKEYEQYERKKGQHMYLKKIILKNNIFF